MTYPRQIGVHLDILVPGDVLSVIEAHFDHNSVKYIVHVENIQELVNI